MQEYESLVDMSGYSFGKHVLSSQEGSHTYIFLGEVLTTSALV